MNELVCEYISQFVLALVVDDDLLSIVPAARNRLGYFHVGISHAEGSSQQKRWFSLSNISSTRYFIQQRILLSMFVFQPKKNLHTYINFSQNEINLPNMLRHGVKITKFPQSVITLIKSSCFLGNKLLFSANFSKTSPHHPLGSIPPHRRKILYHKIGIFYMRKTQLTYFQSICGWKKFPANFPCSFQHLAKGRFMFM